MNKQEENFSFKEQRGDLVRGKDWMITLKNALFILIFVLFVKLQKNNCAGYN